MKKRISLYDKIIARENIFTAIYSIESYIFERYLLSEDDLVLLNSIKDKYNEKAIESVIEQCEDRLREILDNEDELFEAEVYLKFKKVDDKDQNQKQKVSFRPIHTASLVDQICIVCMLNLLMFDDSKDKGRQLSEISNLLPSYFYGNIPSKNLDHLFIPWAKKYKEYTQTVLNRYHTYLENKKYKNAVTLDLKNFFPSINPSVVYNLITNSFSHLYHKDDRKCFERVLIKLLYFKLKNKRDIHKDYYNKSVSEYEFEAYLKENNNLYTQGIPQGLPQSYFFGNLCMVLVEKEIKKEIKGEGYYYVDDSTIFTKENFTDKFFSECIEKINKSLKQKYSKKESIYKKAENFNKYVDYTISIHKGDKSHYSALSKENNEWLDLLFIAKQTSTISYDLFSSIDDSDNSTLKAKVEALLEDINKKIQQLEEKVKSEKDSCEKEKNQLKLLIRYRKFYQFRLRILSQNELNNNDINVKSSDINAETPQYNYFYNYTELFDSDLSLERCKRLVEEDIFWVESLLLIKNNKNDDSAQKRITKKAADFESKLYSFNKEDEQQNSEYLYYKKVTNALIYDLQLVNNKYNSLSKRMQQCFPDYYKSISTESLISKVKLYLKEYFLDSNLKDSEEKLGKLNKIILKKKRKNPFNTFVFKYSNSYQRKFYNALFSNLLSVPISDYDNIVKVNGKSIRYFELRLLVYLRNNEFDAEKFKTKLQEIINTVNKDGYQKIDFSLLDVLPIFKKHVISPDDIDRLILLHKYVNSLWKNGSKFLYFYTLHNEEHSVELIKSASKLTRAINFLTLKRTDFFILFAACYLHDISMVLYPDVYDFIPDKGDSDLIYTNFKDKINQSDYIPKEKIKELIVNNYEEVNEFFEKRIRNTHASSSANYIKKRSKEIDRILKNPEKQFVADVSEAHGFSTYDVYGLRSRAKSDTVNTKYLMILLRLADLMDMVKDRVSVDILKQNIRHIPKDSKFHWISHLVTDKCEIKSNYEHNKDKEDVFCQSQSIIEEFTVELTLNIKRLQDLNENMMAENKVKENKPEKKFHQCTHMECVSKESDSCLEIEILENKVKKEKICKNKCYFLCKWMQIKNEYLFNELYDLQKYLNRNTRNLFKSKMKVLIKYEDSNLVPAEYIDIVRDKIIESEN